MQCSRLGKTNNEPYFGIKHSSRFNSFKFKHTFSSMFILLQLSIDKDFKFVNLIINNSSNKNPLKDKYFNEINVFNFSIKLDSILSFVCLNKSKFKYVKFFSIFSNEKKVLKK